MERYTPEELAAIYNSQLEDVRSKLANWEKTSPRIFKNLHYYFQRIRELSSQKDKSEKDKEELTFALHRFKELTDEKESMLKDCEELRQRERALLLHLDELEPHLKGEEQND